jgi:hypothetical protein
VHLTTKYLPYHASVAKSLRCSARILLVTALMISRFCVYSIGTDAGFYAFIRAKDIYF